MTDAADLAGICVIVPAAGIGERMDAGIPKQYLVLAGKTILQHTLERFLSLNPDRVVVVVSPDDEFYESVPCMNDCEVVDGGAERSDSVLNGVDHLSLGDNDFVMVQDAVRPCVRTEDILKLVDAVKDHPVGGLLAMPVNDTVKQVEAGEVVRTLDRSTIWLAQTPQMFRFGLLKSALQAAQAPTDEASAIELSGHKPIVVEGSQDNIKITRVDDLEAASRCLADSS